MYPAHFRASMSCSNGRFVKFFSQQTWQRQELCSLRLSCMSAHNKRPLHICFWGHSLQILVHQHATKHPSRTQCSTQSAQTGRIPPLSHTKISALGGWGVVVTPRQCLQPTNTGPHHGPCTSRWCASDRPPTSYSPSSPVLPTCHHK